MQTASRMGIMDLLKEKPSTSEFVVVCKNTSPIAGWALAEAGSFVKQLACEYHTCKRVVAVNLGLNIISDYPLNMK